MSKKNIASVLFFSGVSILIILAVLIFSEAPPQENSVLCEKKTEYEFKEESNILWSDSKYFVQFNETKKNLELSSWKIENSNFVTFPLSKIELACEKPNYNCPSIKEKIDVKFFNPPIGIMQINHGKHFPFTWDSKSELRLGAPISLCQKNINEIKNIKFFNFGSNLFVYDFQRNIIGYYDSNSFTGASLSSQAVDAQKVYTILGDGEIVISNCDFQLNNEIDVFNLVKSKKQLFVYKTNKRGWLYDFNKDFIPKAKSTKVISNVIKDEKNEFLYYSDLKNLYFMDSGQNSEIETSDVKSEQLQKVFNNKAKNYTLLKSALKVLNFTEGTVFNKESIALSDLKTGLEYHSTGSRNFRNKKYSYVDIDFLSPKEAFVFIQREGSSGFFTSFECK